MIDLDHALLDKRESTSTPPMNTTYTISSPGGTGFKGNVKLNKLPIRTFVND
jgi:hypothetical protein